MCVYIYYYCLEKENKFSRRKSNALGAIKILYVIRFDIKHVNVVRDLNINDMINENY
jgi:hypothetical protein